MILIRFLGLTSLSLPFGLRLAGLIMRPSRVIADLIRNPQPTTHLTKGLRVKSAMTFYFGNDVLQRNNLVNLFNLNKIVVQTKIVNNKNR